MYKTRDVIVSMPLRYIVVYIEANVIPLMFSEKGFDYF